MTTGMVPAVAMTSGTACRRAATAILFAVPGRKPRKIVA